MIQVMEFQRNCWFGRLQGIQGNRFPALWKSSGMGNTGTGTWSSRLGPDPGSRLDSLESCTGIGGTSHGFPGIL